MSTAGNLSRKYDESGSRPRWGGRPSPTAVAPTLVFVTDDDAAEQRTPAYVGTERRLPV